MLLVGIVGRWVENPIEANHGLDTFVPQCCRYGKGGGLHRDSDVGEIAPIIGARE